MTRRIEIHSGPDRLGRYSYTLYWIATYHPGDPKGEHRVAERGQSFHGPLPDGTELSHEVTK